MALFPTLPSGALPDASKFSTTLTEKGTSSTPTEGGYAVTRAKSTLRIRREYSVAYSFIDTADKNVIEQFWRDHFGGGVDFQWEHPVDETLKLVRFKGSMTIKQVGVGDGAAQHWDVSFELEQA